MCLTAIWNSTIGDNSWRSTFSAMLISGGNWANGRCALEWKFKETKTNRFFIKLLAGKSVHILPTPLAADGNRTGEMVAGKRKIRNSGYRGTSNLVDMALSGLLPTPTTREYKGGRSPAGLMAAGRAATNSLSDYLNAMAGTACKLNPLFVCEMMGFPVDWSLKPFKK